MLLIHVHNNEEKRRPTVHQTVECRDGYKYDTTIDRCVEDAVRTQVVTEYKLQLLLHNTSLVDEYKLVQHVQEWENLAKEFQPFMQRLAISVNVSRYSYSVGLFKKTPQWWQHLNYVALPIYFSARMQVNVNETTHDDYSDSVLGALGDWIPVNATGQLISMEIKLFNGSYDVHSEINFFSDVESGECCTAGNRSGKYEDIQVTSDELVFYEMSCPYIHLTEEEDYELVNGELRLVFEDLGRKSRIVKPRFSFHGDDMITMCKDLYEKYFNETWTLVQRFRNPLGEIKWSVLLTFLSFSLLGLFLAFLTYCVFPTLRTIPAKNNMGLISCLFMAQLVYVSGYVKTENQLLCQVIGVWLHYFWLSAIFWMNVCSFHVFKTFVRSNTIPTGPSRSCALVSRYFLYANGLPVLIVSTVVIANRILSEGQEIGYGGRVCFLSTVLLNGLTVVLPLCFVLISNFGFFTTTIYTISKTKQIQRNTGGERQNLWIYIKLSSITGLFWVFAIVGAASNVEALRYISIVVNSSQGVFLFFSYCCNKRVIQLWKDKLTGVGNGRATTHSSRSTRTRGTETTELPA